MKGVMYVVTEFSLHCDLVGNCHVSAARKIALFPVEEAHCLNDRSIDSES